MHINIYQVPNSSYVVSLISIFWELQKVVKFDLWCKRMKLNAINNTFG